MHLLVTGPYGKDGHCVICGMPAQGRGRTSNMQRFQFCEAWIAHLYGQILADMLDLEELRADWQEYVDKVRKKDKNAKDK